MFKSLGRANKLKALTVLSSLFGCSFAFAQAKSGVQLPGLSVNFGRPPFLRLDTINVRTWQLIPDPQAHRPQKDRGKHCHGTCGPAGSNASCIQPKEWRLLKTNASPKRMAGQN